MPGPLSATQNSWWVSVVRRPFHAHGTVSGVAEGIFYQLMEERCDK